MGEISIIKRGRPTKYSNSVISRAKHYTETRLKDGDFPTIEGLALELGVSARTLYGWETEHPEFFQTMDTLRDAQKHMLIRNALFNRYNARMAIFLLKASHGLSDAPPPIHATQNNYMNISPEVLADAMKLMEKDNQ
ncbi:MAG: terminase small subunit [Bacteroidota bacterium]